MEGTEDDPQEDWLLDSLEKYEGVYIFELQYPTSCLEWNPDGSSVWMVSMAGESDSEILQLALPERLLPQDKQTLWAKRDFKLVNGAFVGSRVTSIKYWSATQSVVSGDVRGKVQVWGCDATNPDLLHCTEQLELVPKGVAEGCGTLLDVSPSHPSLLLSGLSPSLHSLRLLDLSSKATLFSLPPSGLGEGRPLHAITCLDPHTFLSCSGCVQGVGLDLWDSRQPPTPHSQAATPTQSTVLGGKATSCCSMDVSGHGTASGGVRVAVLADTGSLALFDSRSLQQGPTATCQLGGGAKGELPFNYSTRFGSSVSSKPLPCVKLCPDHSNMMAVSGVDDGVKVYDTSAWSCDTTGPAPLFSHLGHRAECSGAEVMVHSWQPGVGGATILSVDTQANLHAWQWKPPQLQ